MKIVAVIILLISIGVVLANYFLEDNGYVLLEFIGYSIETSVPVFVLGLLGLYICLRIIGLVWNSPNLSQREAI